MAAIFHYCLQKITIRDYNRHYTFGINSSQELMIVATLSSLLLFHRKTDL